MRENVSNSMISCVDIFSFYIKICFCVQFSTFRLTKKIINERICLRRFICCLLIYFIFLPVYYFLICWLISGVIFCLLLFWLVVFLYLACLYLVWFVVCFLVSFCFLLVCWFLGFCSFSACLLSFGLLVVFWFPFVFACLLFYSFRCFSVYVVVYSMFIVFWFFVVFWFRLVFCVFIHFFLCLLFVYYFLVSLLFSVFLFLYLLLCLFVVSWFHFIFISRFFSFAYFYCVFSISLLFLNVTCALKSRDEKKKEKYENILMRSKYNALKLSEFPSEKALLFLRCLWHEYLKRDK